MPHIRRMIKTRPKKPISLAVDPDLLDAIEAWIAEQVLIPSKTAVFETALREFLDKREQSPKKRGR